MGVSQDLISSEYFLKGQTSSDYIESMQINKEGMEKWRDSAASGKINLKGLEAARTQYNGNIRAVIVTEEWCPDTFGVLPLLHRAESEIDGFTLRIFRASEHKEMNSRFEAAGLDRFPKVLFLNSHEEEIARLVERSAAAESEMNRLKEIHGDPVPYLHSDDQDQKKIGADIAHIISNELLQLHEAGLWQATVDEIAESISHE